LKIVIEICTIYFYDRELCCEFGNEKISDKISPGVYYHYK